MGRQEELNEIIEIEVDKRLDKLENTSDVELRRNLMREIVRKDLFECGNSDSK